MPTCKRLATDHPRMPEFEDDDADLLFIVGCAFLLIGLLVGYVLGFVS